VPLLGFWADGRQLGNNPADRRAELGVEVHENGVCGNFDHQGTRSVSNLPEIRLFEKYGYKTFQKDFRSIAVVVNADAWNSIRWVSASYEGYPKGCLDEECWSHGATGDELSGGCDTEFTA
jgi:hypothetical protein